MRAVFGQLPRTYWFLVAGMFVNRVGAFVLPFLSLYLKDHERLSAGEISAVLACWGVGTIVAGLLGGHLADRWGRKPTMLLSLLGGAVVLAGLGSAHGAFALAALALAFGVVAELYRPAVAAAIADLVAPLDRPRAFGHLTWAYNLGFAVSPLLAGLLIDHAGYVWLFAGDAVTMVLAAVLLAGCVSETRPAAASLAVDAGGNPTLSGAPLRDRRFLPLLAAAFLLGTVMIQSLATLAHVMRTDGLGAATFGRVIALNGMLIALGQPWLVPQFERLGRYRVLPIAAAIFGCGFALHGLAGSTGGHVFAVVVWTLGEIALFPLCNAAVADLAPEHLRGRYQGTYWMAFATANVVGPPAGLSLLALLGPLGWGASLAAAGALGGIALAVAGQRVPRRPAPAIDPDRSPAPGT
jgi:MFS family permease